ncbi:hypothetical protein HYALB_00011929 [Hymenoscyphus albidus]|uniref:Rhodopsin domain-containing protein n=1 Tax=Hymenoscyphus albidus TaxID=595503 RepID=A0A9N9Q893_9HELO|nr:hypothetical protein HYALB_00011929 [Hymenoscyphus albidus]
MSFGFTIKGVPVVMPILPGYEGYDVDFENPQRNGATAVYGICGIFMPLAFFAVLQRMYFKAFIRKQVGLDDYLLIGAWAFSVAIQSLIIHSFIAKYCGVHAFEMPIDKFGDFVKFTVYVSSAIYVIPTLLSKQVILMFYLQLGNNSKFFKWAVYFIMFANFGSNVGIFFSAIFTCAPVSLAWEFTKVPGINTTGTCINRFMMFQAQAWMAMTIDFLILFLPSRMVINLQMSTKKKIGLLATFAVGSATCITSVLRLVFFLDGEKEIDAPWAAGPSNVLLALEANLLIICASITTIRAFVKAVFPNLITSLNGTPGAKKSSGGSSWFSLNKWSKSRSRSKPSGHSDQKSYEKFGEENDLEAGFGMGMSTLVKADLKPLPALPLRGTGTSNDKSWLADQTVMDPGEEVIVQETTTTMTYSNRA